MTDVVSESLDSDGDTQALEQALAEFTDDWAQNYIQTHKFRCLDDAKRISGLGEHRRVLNIGGAPYLFELFASARGHVVTSLDIDPGRHQAQIHRLNINAIACDFERSDERQKLDFRDYDVICMCEVLEHMRIDLIGLLKFVAANMRADGRLYVTTPNFFYAPHFVSNMLKGRSGPSLVDEWSKLERLGHMGHVREYARTELVELFEFAGFRVVQSSVRNSRSLKIGTTVRGFLRSVVLRFLAEHFDRFGQEFVFVLEKQS